jgi:hypothetical protein
MGCLVIQNLLDGKDRELLENDEALTPVESLALQQGILSGQEPAFIDLIVALLKAGRGHRQIIDTIQLASAQLIIETGDVTPTRAAAGYEYCNRCAGSSTPSSTRTASSCSSWPPPSSPAPRITRSTPGQQPGEDHAPKGSDG